MSAVEAVLGVDVGGTTVKAALVRRDDLTIIDRSSAPTDPRAISAGILALARPLLHRAAERGLTVSHAGIGVPEFVRDGRVTSAEVIEWTGTEPGELGALLRTSSHDEVSVRVDSDVRCGARAEAHLLPDPAQSALYVSWGTGISSTFVLPGGVCWEGATGRAITLGAWPSAASAFTVEEFSSGLGIARRFRALHGGDTHPARAGEELTTLAVSRRADSGDVEAEVFLAEAGRVLATAVLQAVDLLDPHVVILGGGLGVSDSTAPRAAFEALRARPGLAALPARLGADSGLIGAALGTTPFDGQLR